LAGSAVKGFGRAELDNSLKTAASTVVKVRLAGMEVEMEEFAA